MRDYRIVGVLLWVVGVSAPAAEPAPKPGPAPIAETQLTLRLNPVQGRATVIGIADETLTVVTAAHVLSAGDVGRTILLIQQQGRLSGRVVAVTRNPLFHQIRSRNPHELLAEGTLGVDSAVVTIAVDLQHDGERRVFKLIKAADLTAQAIPGRPDQIVPVRIVDQYGLEHVLRAGNHLNPKCLAWGRASFDTRPGDSGAGVFLMRNTPEGEPRPILIGVVSQTDDRGAIGSLIHRDEPWIEDTLAHPQPEPR
jgi:hypothetical protein